jgi:hypothetical protein
MFVDRADKILNGYSSNTSPECYQQISIYNSHLIDVVRPQYTGHTQKNGTVLIVNTIKTAPFFCVCPVFNLLKPNGYLMHQQL